MKELENAKELPKQARTVILLELVTRSMHKLGLSWQDIAKELVGSECPLCESRIRNCPSCKREVAVGHINCVSCGSSLELVELEPALKRKT